MTRLIIPGILTDSVQELQEKVRLAAGFAGRVSIDVVDGLFADNLTVMPEDMRQVDWQGLKVDVQLMVEEPVDYLGQLHLMKADRVFGHVEKMGQPEEFVERCEELGLTLGWGFDLHSPVTAIDKELLMNSEGVLLMAVRAGFSGQGFDSQVLVKIRQLREVGYSGDMVIDGGMNRETIPLCLEAGANQFSVTSALWDGSPEVNYYELVELLG